jgi:hypothetical protein
VSPALWALVTLGILVPASLVPLAVRQPYRVGVARHPQGAWASTVLAISFVVAAMALMGLATELGRLAPKAQPAVLGAFGIGVLVGLLAYTLSTWQNHRGVVYFHPNQRVTLVIASLTMLRIAYGLWRIWSASGVASVDRRWMASVGMAGTLAAAALLTGYGLGFWGAVRLRIAHWKSVSMFALDTTARHSSSVRGSDTMMLQR